MVNVDIHLLPHLKFRQQWPRVTIALFALWGLYGGFSSLWLGLRLNQSHHDGKKLSHPFGEGAALGPEEEDKIIKMTLITLGALSILVDGIALFASIRKSIWATKVSLGFWIMQFGWLVLGLGVLLITYFSLSEKDREQLPNVSAWDWFQSIFALVLTFFYGWALVVFLRDLKHRPRDAWGRLVRTAGVFEYEPIGEGHVRI